MSNEPKTTVETEEKTYYHGGKAVARKFAFASGELVYNLPWMLVSSYLAFFMTDVALIPASAVSILFLICRIWDAINDPMIGSLADRTNTKMGRYRPWMLGGAIGLIPLVVLLFWAHPGWSVGARTAYGCILYFITVVASTSWNIPFSALNGVISPYPRERASFSSYRIFISSIACSVATALFIPFVTKFSGAEGNTVRGYLLAALVICCMAIPFVFTSILGTKEVVKAPPQQKQKFHAKEMAACFTKNPPLLIVCFAFLVYGFLNYGRMTVGMYYFTYVWGDVSLFTLYATVNGLICAVAAFFSAALVKLCRGKRGALLLSYGLSFILNIILFFLSPENASSTLVLVLLFGTGIFNGFCTALLYGMIGMIGVQIWVDNKVDFAKPINIMTASVVMIVGIANFEFNVNGIQFNGIAIGSIIVLVLYHGMKAIGRATGTIVKEAPEPTPQERKFENLDEPIDPTR